MDEIDAPPADSRRTARGSPAEALESPAAFHYEPLFRAANRSLDVILVPPVIGLHPAVRDGLAFVAKALAGRGHRTIIVSFPGQHGHSGLFSVQRSCEQLASMLNGVPSPHLLFGICSGALAALAAAAGSRSARGVLCWDLASRFDYTERVTTALTRRYGVRFCPATGHTPVQATDLVAAVQVPIAFGSPPRSFYTRPAQQRELAALARRGTTFSVEGAGHFPGVPRGSEHIFTEFIARWARHEPVSAAIEAE